MGERFYIEYIITCRDKIMSEEELPKELVEKNVCPEYQIETVIRKIGIASVIGPSSVKN